VISVCFLSNIPALSLHSYDFSGVKHCVYQQKDVFPSARRSTGQCLTPEWPPVHRGHKLSCHFHRSSPRPVVSGRRAEVSAVSTPSSQDLFLGLLSTNKGGSSSALNFTSVWCTQCVGWCHQRAPHFTLLTNWDFSCVFLLPQQSCL